MIRDWSTSTIVALFFFLVPVACHRHGHCENSACTCDPGDSCDFECDAPPCHVECEGDNPDCVGACANGDCTCGPGSHCDLSCQSEPCHVDCKDSTCLAQCGNGDCTCERGSDCQFECTSGPCHVICEGDHKRCDGECADGTCSCGADSSCVFSCLDANCDFECAQGSSCIATCEGATPGNQGCSFSECFEGTPQVCPDGKTIVCNADCPTK